MGWAPVRLPLRSSQGVAAEHRGWKSDDTDTEDVRKTEADRRVHNGPRRAGPMSRVVGSRRAVKMWSRSMAAQAAPQRFAAILVLAFAGTAAAALNPVRFRAAPDTGAITLVAPDVTAAIVVADGVLADEKAVAAVAAGELAEHIALSTGRDLPVVEAADAAEHELVILVGPEKLVSAIGERGRLPIEVLPFGEALVRHELAGMGLDASLREGKDGETLVTDNGNWVLDAKLSPPLDARALEQTIVGLPGVLGTGFFLGMADAVLVGSGEDVEIRRRS